jgi:hypothetical protein
MAWHLLSLNLHACANVSAYATPAATPQTPFGLCKHGLSLLCNIFIGIQSDKLSVFIDYSKFLNFVVVVI